MTRLKELKTQLEECEEYAVSLRKSNETFEKVLANTKEELRKAKVAEKHWRERSARSDIERDEWKKMATRFMEQLVTANAELEVAKLPF